MKPSQNFAVSDTSTVTHDGLTHQPPTSSPLKYEGFIIMKLSVLIINFSTV